MNPLVDILQGIDAMKFIHLFTISLCWVQTATALQARTFGGCQSKKLRKRDGICFTHTAQVGDTCASLAESHSISVSDIETWNTGSWGWSGCAKMMPGDFVCLSSGGSSNAKGSSECCLWSTDPWGNAADSLFRSCIRQALSGWSMCQYPCLFG